MEKEFDDEKLPDDFEEIAHAYSKALKNKGVVFVSLEEEEFNLLLCEVFVILAKMDACAETIVSMDCRILREKICKSREILARKFGKSKQRKFACRVGENEAFLSLVSLENLLVMKLMLLSVKSGQFEVCNRVSTGIVSVFAESFSTECFDVL